MVCSKPGFPVLHYFPEFAELHIHWVGNAIQPSHPLLFSSTPAFNLCQYQGLFQWVGSSHQVSEESVWSLMLRDIYPLTGLSFYFLVFCSVLYFVKNVGLLLFFNNILQSAETGPWIDIVQHSKWDIRNFPPY